MGIEGNANLDRWGLVYLHVIMRYRNWSDIQMFQGSYEKVIAKGSGRRGKNRSEGEFPITRR